MAVKICHSGGNYLAACKQFAQNLTPLLVFSPKTNSPQEVVVGENTNNGKESSSIAFWKRLIREVVGASPTTVPYSIYFR